MPRICVSGKRSMLLENRLRPVFALLFAVIVTGPPAPDEGMTMHMRTIAFMLLLVFAAVGLLAVFQCYAPTEHNPFKPLAITDPVGAATFHKLAGLEQDTEKCFSLLDEGGIFYTRLDDTTPRRHCGFYDALTLDQSLAPYSATLRMTCPLTASLAVWEQHVALPLAEEILGSPIARVETFGTYNCRRIGGGTAGRLSEHATANAIDISGFKLADGRLISVKKHWGQDSPEGKFLHDVREGACRVFAVTLSPDYNAAHADHFHFDMGAGDICK